MQRKLKVAVLFGGSSGERDVSIASGAQVVQALRARGHEVLAVDTCFGLLPANEEPRYLSAKVGEVPPPSDSFDGYSRTDFRLDAAGQLWCLEVNSLPGMTATSLLPQSAAASGIDVPELCERICALALQRHAR